MVIFLSS